MKLRILCFLLALSLLPLPALAAEGQTAEGTEAAESTASLDEQLAGFRADWGLTEDNFAMTFVDLESGESLSFQYDQWMVAASTFKVPLAMLYYDKISAGELTEDSTVGGWQLGRALDVMIVNSDNDAAKALMYAIGNNVWSQYRALLTALSEQEYPDSFYSSNIMNCHFMTDCLTYLYENADAYSELLADMAAAMPDAYFQKYTADTQWTVCHKYGYYEGAVNDVAIVYGPRNYILVAYSQGVSDAETMLGELNRLVYTYLEQEIAEAEAQAALEAQAMQAAQEAQEAEAEADSAAAESEAEAAAAESAELSPSPAPAIALTVSGEFPQASANVSEAKADPESSGWTYMALVFPLAAAAGMALLVGMFWLVRARKKRKKARRQAAAAQK